MTAFHRRKNAIRAVLHRQVQVTRERWYFRIGLNQAIGKLNRVRRRETNSINALDRVNVVNERRKIGDAAIVHRTPISIYILAKQIYFANSLLCELCNLLNHAIKRTTDLFATRVRDHTKAAVLTASFHNRDERSRPFRTRLWQAVEFLDLRK